MTRQASTIEDHGEPFLCFTRRGTREMPVELCIQETPESPLVIYRLDGEKGLHFAAGALNNAVMGK